ncbi:hypothetical protein SESBI_47836 [Sesbania bispinosa]|nr:hypothetical protein SESBI_47836 [Sesbania bispinosa]
METLYSDKEINQREIENDNRTHTLPLRRNQHRKQMKPKQQPQPSKPPHPPLPVFEFKEGTISPWKFSRESPRLSLDSRAVVDAKGTFEKLRRD